MKVVFLDIDGVLNWAGTKDRIDGYIGLDPTRIERFNRIMDAHPDARIVISSTWRRVFTSAYQDFEGLVDLLLKRGLRGQVIGLTPAKMSSSRGQEIRMWMDDFRDDNPDTKLTYVVLDDDREGMEGWTNPGAVWAGRDDLGQDLWQDEVLVEDLRPRHVVTFWDGLDANPDGVSEEGGLQDRHIEQAIKLLSQ